MTGHWPAGSSLIIHQRSGGLPPDIAAARRSFLAAAIALGNQGDQSGTASSVYGFTNFAVAGLVSPLAGVAGITNATPVALVLLATSTISLAGVGLILRTARTHPTRRDPGEHAAAAS